MSTRVLLTLRTDDGHRDDLLAFLRSVLPSTRTSNGCERVFLCQSGDDPTVFLVDQQWTSKDSYLQYSRWRRDRGDLAPFATLLIAPPVIEFHAQLDAW